jgi:hypothetical protein
MGSARIWAQTPDALRLNARAAQGAGKVLHRACLIKLFAQETLLRITAAFAMAENLWRGVIDEDP